MTWPTPQEQAEKAAESGHGEAGYWSALCQQTEHVSCRRVCLWCSAPCQCGCHRRISGMGQR